VAAPLIKAGAGALAKTGAKTLTKRGGQVVRVFVHGSDITSVEGMIEHGISSAEAAEHGGGDVFWALPESRIADARVFAASNPSGGLPAVLGVRIGENSLSALVDAGAIEIEHATGYIQVLGWEEFNAAAEFFRYE
jgi:hypothetical protein